MQAIQNPENSLDRLSIVCRDLGSSAEMRAHGETDGSTLAGTSLSTSPLFSVD
jgi:hypothetical protein